VLAFERNPQQFSPDEMRRSAERFSAARFRRRFASLVYAAWGGGLSWWRDDEFDQQPLQIMAHSVD